VPRENLKACLGGPETTSGILLDEKKNCYPAWSLDSLGSCA
jgi:hypothetical protein